MRYPFASLYALTHAYAISVHKAQGAEFPAVVMPLVTAHAALLGRTLLYTAFTRARQLVVIVGQRKALGLAVRDWRRAPRHTALGGILTGALTFAWPGGRTRRRGTDMGEDWWEGLTWGRGGGAPFVRRPASQRVRQTRLLARSHRGLNPPQKVGTQDVTTDRYAPAPWL